MFKKGLCFKLKKFHTHVYYNSMVMTQSVALTHTSKPSLPSLDKVISSRDI